MIIIGLGSNMGDRLMNLRQAATLLEQKISKIVRYSSVWETEPWGYKSDNSFFNAVCILDHVKIEALVLLNYLRQIEGEIGRKRNQNKGYEDRIIDIDLIAYDRVIIQTNEITVPHPRMHLRKFVLLPLEEIEPTWHHPVLEKNIRTLIQECPDTTMVSKTDYLLL